jgi:hypothetical protein
MCSLVIVVSNCDPLGIADCYPEKAPALLKPKKIGNIRQSMATSGLCLQTLVSVSLK